MGGGQGSVKRNLIQNLIQRRNLIRSDADFVSLSLEMAKASGEPEALKSGAEGASKNAFFRLRNPCHVNDL